MDNFRKKYGIYTWFGYDIPITDILDKIKQAGFPSVFLWWDHDLDEYYAPLGKVVEMARERGLDPENGHMPYYHMNCIWEDTLDGKDYFDRYMGLINDARLAEMDRLVIHPFEMELPVAKRKADLGLSRFARLGEFARKCGIKLAIENIQDNESLEMVIDYLNDEYAGLCYDSGHDNVMQRTLYKKKKEEQTGILLGDGFEFVNHNYDLLDKYSNKVYAVHLHDNDGTADWHSLPLTGNIDWKSLSDKLESTSYDRSCMLEAMYSTGFKEEGFGRDSDDELTDVQYLARAYQSCYDLTHMDEYTARTKEENEL